jgi:hypothetical protein
VIPHVADVLDGWRFTARRIGLDGTASRTAVAAGLEHATALAAGNVHDEPAALFYAFACRPKAFLGGWRVAAFLLAKNHASDLGLRIVATPEEIADMRHRMAWSDRPSFDEVRDWFAARTKPR